MQAEQYLPGVFWTQLFREAARVASTSLIYNVIKKSKFLRLNAKIVLYISSQDFINGSQNSEILYFT